VSPERRALHQELHATVAAQRELGGDYDADLTTALAERLDRELRHHRRTAVVADAVTVAIALGSIGLGVLVTAAAGRLGDLGGTLATVVAWVVIAVVNVAHARSR